MTIRRHVLLVLVAALFTSVAAHAEMIDNPAYTSWAKHKPGTKLTMQTQTSAMGMNMTQNMTSTLQEITPEKAVVEAVVSVDMGGMKHEMKQKNEIPAKVEQAQANLPPDMKGSIKEVGNEPVTISGKSYDCKVMEFTGESAQSKATGKIWTCQDIPGNMAKMESKMQEPQPATMSMTVTAIELK